MVDENVKPKIHGKVLLKKDVNPLVDVQLPEGTVYIEGSRIVISNPGPGGFPDNIGINYLLFRKPNGEHIGAAYLNVPHQSHGFNKTKGPFMLGGVQVAEYSGSEISNLSLPDEDHYTIKVKLYFPSPAGPGYFNVGGNGSTEQGVYLDVEADAVFDYGAPELMPVYEVTAEPQS